MVNADSLLCVSSPCCRHLGKKPQLIRLLPFNNNMLIFILPHSHSLQPIKPKVAPEQEKHAEVTVGNEELSRPSTALSDFSAVTELDDGNAAGTLKCNQICSL